MSTTRRRGMVLVELAAACGVLMALMAVVAGMLALSQRGRRDAERQSWALTEAANCLERLSAVRWDELTPQRVEEETLSPSARAVLGPAAKLSATIDEAKAVLAGRKVSVEVHYSNDGRPAPAVRLITWRYDLGAAESQP